jgi:branched-subunit amino acid aminotransferase/4-amino-4-deoxychorismate lyase
MRHSLDGVACDAVPPEFALHPYGCFTTFLVEEGGVLSWDRHLARLRDGAQQMWGEEIDPAVITSALQQHFGSDHTGVWSVRVSLYPALFDHLAPETAHGHRVLVSSRPAAPPNQAVSELHVRTAQFRRDHPELKSTGLTAQLRIRREVRLAGGDDALFLDGDDVLEGASWSVIALANGRARSPVDGILESTTLSNVMKVLRALGWLTVRGPLTVKDVEAAELVLAVNVNQPIRPITRINEHNVASDRALIAEIVHGYALLERSPLWSDG